MPSDSHGDITGTGRPTSPGKNGARRPNRPAAQAICELFLQPKASFSDGFKLLKEQYRWSQVVQPLATSLNGSKTASPYTLGARPDIWGAHPLDARYGLARGRQILQQEGWKSFFRKARRHSADQPAKQAYLHHRQTCFSRNHHPRI